MTRGVRPSLPGLIPAVAVILLVAARRWRQMGELPTGLDGGEWLAIGRGLLGGPGRLTEGAYAPLVPAGIHVLAGVLGPVPAVRVAAAVSLAAVLLALAVISARPAGPWLAAALAIAAGSASAISEPVAFGGYPQHVAFAAGLAGVAGLAAMLLGGGKRSAVVAIAGFAGCALSHHVYFPLMACAGVAAAGLWLSVGQRWRTMPHLRLAAVALGTIVPGAALALPTMLAFQRAGYSPPIGTEPLTLTEAWSYATREATPAWTIIAMLAPVALGATRTQVTAAWLVAGGMWLSSAAAFAIVPQPRLAPALLVASLLALAVAASRVRLAGNWSIAGAVGTVVLLAILASSGDRAAADYFRYYRSLDRSMLDAARVIDRAAENGSVAVRADRRGWPVGWWFEGLTSKPVLVGSDPRWLGFPGERVAAARVADLFDGTLTPDALRRGAETAGIGFLVCRKWDWIGWEHWLAASEPAVDVIYDDEETIVLRIIGEVIAENVGV